MRKEKFTPGPWRVDNCWPNIYIRHEGIGFPIGSAYCGDQFILCKDAVATADGMEPREIRLANAHLISAAPEMYELLQRIKDEMECTPEWYRFMNDVETILKKARGEA